MNRFVEEFNVRSLAENLMIKLTMRYDLDPCDFAIDYDEGSCKWILTYDP